ncbi:MAG: M81 family metallopeptidase [Planctomycetes bacterium]|nr:M81 family metallopeptidase [Planctomycetota bacterium]
MRIGIIALMQESNTFITAPTTFAHFEQDLLLEGDAVRTRFADAHHEVGGFFAGLAAERLDAVPIFAARALPYGIVAADAFDALLARMDAAIDRAGPLDGLLVAPHGATVCAAHPDADGYWLTRLRQRFGKKFPIIGTLDLHANVSPAMTSACDALIAYRTNPHLDQRQRGIDAAKLMARTVRGEVKPTMAAAFPPLAVNIERQLSAESPCKDVYDFADAMLQRRGVLSNSVVLGFPYADVAEMGSSAIVVTDNDFSQAEVLVKELSGFWWDRREEFVGKMTSIDEAMQQAANLDGPITLLDMGDNVGGGSPGDGTALLHALHAHLELMPAFVCLADPEAVALAQAATERNIVKLRVGGKTDKLHGEPFEALFQVKRLTDGKFSETQPRHGGFLHFDQGPTAVLESGKFLTVMVTTRRMVPFSIKQMTSGGLDPANFRILVAKGVHAPVAAYAPVSKHLIRVDTPGVTSADLSRLTFHHRRRPMFPFERDAKW